MSEQIREQVSAFLDGELPNSETELLLRRLTRDAELRESFGRYALIGESLRGARMSPLTRGFAERVNRALGGEHIAADAPVQQARTRRWWRPFAGVAVAAGVAAVAVVALQQRAVVPTLHAALPVAAQNAIAPAAREAISYTVPASTPEAPAALPEARLTNYVFAHSKYSSGLDQRGVLADMLIENDDTHGDANEPPVLSAPPRAVP
ncbi:MAG: sigma-E factor negative regulatory protein [Pseudomonadota bacterium]|nr:sigma-E factor negative regulatory protein [Pseudomonadota bacterium]